MEEQKTIQALRTAIQMEIDGKGFYLKASQGSSNKLGRGLLAALAAEEDIHRQKFEEIFRSIQAKKGWGKTRFQPDGGRKLRTIFASTEKLADRGNDSELEAVKTAIEMENRSYDFYTGRSRKADFPAEKGFYSLLAGEEKGHQLVLLDYFEYLKDPAAWFVNKEHPSLDGA